jgi:hypothetical protein
MNLRHYSAEIDEAAEGVDDEDRFPEFLPEFLQDIL